MHQSIPAAPCPPPRANPRALAFFSLGWQIPRGWEHLSYQMPRGRDEGRGQMPRPRNGTSPINTAAVFIHCTIMPLSALNVRFFVSVGLPLRLLLFVMALSDVNKLNNAKHGILILHRQHYTIVDCLKTVR